MENMPKHNEDWDYSPKARILDEDNGTKRLLAGEEMNWLNDTPNNKNSLMSSNGALSPLGLKGNYEDENKF